MKIEDVEKILENPATRSFVSETYKKAVNKDIVDSIYDLKLVVKMLEYKFNNICKGVK